MKRIVIVGATSGLGNEAAKLFIAKGWTVGAAGRRQQPLDALRALAPERVATLAIDVLEKDAPERLYDLIRQTGGMDVFLLTSGIGSHNTQLDPQVELSTVDTNATGFTRMVTAAFHYFRSHGGGRIAVISSVAGTKGLGSAPSYSATKRFQSNYIDALAQLARMERLPIRFTDIRPGFVATPMLKRSYPMLMQPRPVARQIVRAIEQGRRRIVIDWRYKAMVFAWRLVPQRLWERISIR